MIKKIFRPISSALLVLILVASFIVPFVNPVSVNAAWYDTDWAYRVSFTVSHASGVVTNYQFPLKVYYGSGTSGTEAIEGITAGKLYCDSKCQTDFDDIRVTTSDEVTLLDYWIESKTDSNNEIIWIEFDSIGVGATTFYVYYGNAAATAVSSGANTFTTANGHRFDNFERGNNGDAIGGDWTIVQGDVDISTEQEYTGVAADTRSGKFIGGATYPKATIPCTASANISIRARFYKEAAVTAFFPIAHGDATTMPYVYITADGSIMYYDTAERDTGVNSTNDVWNLLEINNMNYTADTYDLWHNGTKIGTGLSMRVTGAYNNIIGVLHTDTTATRDAYIDNLIVRNYRATEPVWGTWGTEENLLPTLTTLPRTGFASDWVIVNATMDDDKGDSITSYGFQYGLTNAFGSTATITGDIENGEAFSYRIGSLKAATVYYYRAFAVNALGTGYGNTERFSTKGSPAVYEYYITGGNNDSIDIYGSNWAYQTFTTGTTSHTITSVRLYIKRTLSPGDITVSIRHASGDDPTGVDLVSTTLDGDTISTTYAWNTFAFSSEIGFEASTDYAIVVRCLDGTAANYIEWQINDAGGYASGVYGTSTNGGTTWTDTADDTMFEVWGNPCIEIQDVKVFTGYRQAGDWLITIRYINIYPPYYDTYDIRKYFTFDLLDLGSVVRGTSPLVAWGNRVGSLYLSAAQVGALEIGAAYTVRIYGLFGANPYTDYVLQPADYQGADLTNLDSWVISSASVISTYYNTSMTTYIANKGEVLNSTGGTVMANGISGLATVRPGIFQTASAAGGHTDTPQNQTGVEANPQAIVGPQIWSWVTNLGAPVGADGRQILMLLFVGFYIIFAMWAFVPGQNVAANILGLPMIFGATYFGMSFIYVVILCLVSAFLFVKHFWMDKRA